MSERRFERVIEQMQKSSLDQIVITSTASIYYLTGLWVEPMERMLALYLNADGDCVLFGNRLFCLEEVPGLRLLEHSDGENPLGDLAATVRAGQLGVDESWRSKFLIDLIRLRPDVEPVHGSLPVQLARMIKDEEELAALRRASRINDKAVQMAVSAIHGSCTESEIAGRVDRFYHANGADGVGFALVAFGANAADPHHAPGQAVLRGGDCIVIDIGAPFRRYNCDMTRTVFYGSVGEEQKRVYDTVLRANLAGIAAVRPGKPLSAFDQAARQVICDAGYGKYFTHRLGHGIGIDCHEFPDVSAASEVLAQPGMVFSVEPGVYLPGRFGVRIEDLVAVTEDGCINLNGYTKELQIVE